MCYNTIMEEKLETEEEFWKLLEIWISKNEIQLYCSEPTPFYYLSKDDQAYYDLLRELDFKEHHFQNHLATLMRDKKITKDSELYKSVNMSCALFKKIMKSRDGYVPNKETVFKLCIALQLTIEQAEKLLSYAGYTFNPDSKKDIIVKYPFYIMI